jgi:hypothetical protein
MPGAYGVPPPRLVDSEETRRRHAEALLEKTLKENDRLKAAAKTPDAEPEIVEAAEPLDGVILENGYAPIRGAEIGFGMVNQYTSHMNPIIGVPLAVLGGLIGLFVGSAVESAVTR